MFIFNWELVWILAERITILLLMMVFVKVAHLRRVVVDLGGVVINGDVLPRATSTGSWQSHLRDLQAKINQATSLHADSFLRPDAARSRLKEVIKPCK